MRVFNLSFFASFTFFLGTAFGKKCLYPVYISGAITAGDAEIAFFNVRLHEAGGAQALVPRLCLTANADLQPYVFARCAHTERKKKKLDLRWLCAASPSAISKI